MILKSQLENFEVIKEKGCNVRQSHNVMSKAHDYKIISMLSLQS